jgi:NAD(P)H-hydrate repair Nnr-like enzyme with NAD(P)H-hydrate dehydratase domain
MSQSNDEPKGSSGLDRRAVIRGALAVGGASMLAGTAAAAAKPQVTVVAEREWARALARHIVNQLPEAIRQVRDVQLTDTQVAEIQQAFQNTLVTNMGCEVPPS